MKKLKLEENQDANKEKGKDEKQEEEEGTWEDLISDEEVRTVTNWNQTTICKGQLRFFVFGVEE